MRVGRGSEDAEVDVESESDAETGLGIAILLGDGGRMRGTGGTPGAFPYAAVASPRRGRFCGTERKPWLEAGRTAGVTVPFPLLLLLPKWWP